MIMIIIMVSTFISCNNFRYLQQFNFRCLQQFRVDFRATANCYAHVSYSCNSFCVYFTWLPHFMQQQLISYTFYRCHISCSCNNFRYLHQFSFRYLQQFHLGLYVSVTAKHYRLPVFQVVAIITCFTQLQQFHVNVCVAAKCYAFI